MDPVSVLEGSRKICSKILKALLESKGLLIGRFGTIEFNVINCLPDCPSEMRFVLERNAGVFPSDMDSVNAWALETQKAFQAADVLATGWYAPIIEDEKKILAKWGFKGTSVPLRSLEPYYVPELERWTRLISDVCIVSSFTETAASQITKAGVWPSGSLWSPHCRWSWVKTGYAPCLALGRAGWEESPESWKEAVDWTVEEVLKTRARVVIIGCGGLGMLIGARLKAKGKICIVMGGAVQVLFGIKGERWRTHSVISKFWNSEWVWPSIKETPGGASDVEGACYWSQSNSENS